MIWKEIFERGEISEYRIGRRSDQDLSVGSNSCMDVPDSFADKDAKTRQNALAGSAIGNVRRIEIDKERSA